MFYSTKNIVRLSTSVFITMAQQPLTTAGVAAKETELNGMSANDRATQANLISSDFVSWMNNNFVLSTAQQTYLAGMSSEFINYAAFVTSFAVLHSRPIDLTTSGNAGFKLVTIKCNLEVITSSTGLTVNGGLQFFIEYQ
jgi:hypothetical protein